MNMRLSAPDFALVNEVKMLTSALREHTKDYIGLNTYPKTYSVMLFRRLQNNFRGFILLWEDNLEIESASILRSGIEVVICLAANAVLQDRFVSMLKEDAVETLKRQIKIWRDQNSNDMVALGESTLRDIVKTLPNGINTKSLNWKLLARDGGVPDLYDEYSTISGQLSNVTGFSLIRGTVGLNMESAETEKEILSITRNAHLMIISGTVLRGCKIHAAMIEAKQIEELSDELLRKLNENSRYWNFTE